MTFSDLAARRLGAPLRPLLASVMPGALVTVFAASAPPPACALSLSAMLAKTGLSPEDFKVMNEATDKRPGLTVDWQNPASGASGTVQLTGVEGSCMKLTHLARLAGQQKDIGFRSLRCASGRCAAAPKMANGSFRISPT
ncbi:MAG: hypothetical protein AB7E21_18735 [Pseudodonghicola sp.]